MSKAKKGRQKVYLKSWRKAQEIALSVLDTKSSSESDLDPESAQCSNSLDEKESVQSVLQDNSELKPAHLFQDNWEHINRQNDTLESDSEDSSKPPMHEFIRNWALEFNITGHAVSALMKGLQEYGCDLPDDSRGLLKTPKPRTISISKLSGGDYTYFGVQSGLNDVLRSVNTDFDSITISIHIDGLATFKSKNMTVWPIQATVENIVEIANVPFIESRTDRDMTYRARTTRAR